MTSNQFQQSVPVFVTSCSVGASGEFPIEQGVWLNLEHYSHHTAFMEAALANVKQITAEEDPELLFAKHDAGTWAKDLITEDAVDPQLWELMKHDDDTVAMLKAYRECHNVEKDTSVDEQIETANESYIGHFSSASELIEDWLNRKNTDPSVIEVILPNMDVTAVADAISTEMIFADGHYFE